MRIEVELKKGKPEVLNIEECGPVVLPVYLDEKYGKGEWIRYTNLDDNGMLLPPVYSKLKNEFAKIIVVNDYQVLITKGYDAEDDLFKVHVAIDMDGVRITAIPGYKTKREMNKAFKEYNDESALKFLDSIKDMLK